jgi:hypothetical protein
VFKHLYQKLYKPKRVLFYRDLTAYTGGHQKVADYFGHFISSKYFEPYISFSPASRWDEANPWFGGDFHRLVDYLPTNYDFAFVAGMDWRTYLDVERPVNQPVINFIQHVRHADPAEDVFEYLHQRAIRICVSQQVANSIQQTGNVNGPVFTIPNGVELPVIGIEKNYDLIILGIKQPALALAIYERLKAAPGLRILLVNQQVARNVWFEYLAASRSALLLPNFTEGFYLPALEAMNYCDMVIVPDCMGNRDFCKNNQNCFMPHYNIESILASVEQALASLQNEHLLTAFKHQMRETLRTHSLANERKAFLALMADVKNVWAM